MDANHRHRHRGDTTLELSPTNAEVGPITAEAVAAEAATAAATPAETDTALRLAQWHDSVFAIWSPTSHASGFVVDARGLVATNQRAIGTASAVEVELTPTVKVIGTVLIADAVKDVAILRIDPQVVATVRPVPLGCPLPAPPALVDGQEIFTIGTPLRDHKGQSSGSVRRADPRGTVADLMVGRGSTGGPVFSTDGAVVGLTSLLDDEEAGRRGDALIVRTSDVCGVLAAAEKKMSGAAPPSGNHLPLEADRPFPIDALKAVVETASAA